MIVTQITVKAERVVPDPYIDYANFKPAIELTASLSEAEGSTAKGVAVCTAQLQTTANQMLDAHLRQLLQQYQPQQQALPYR